MHDDPYLDPHTGILRNKPGLTTQKELDAFESFKTAGRLAQLAVRPLAGSFDAEHFQAIHKHIFQDVYDFAGQTRTITAPKIEGSRATRFTPHDQVKAELDSVFQRLSDDNHLRGLTRDQFVVKAAELLGDLNHVHAFREGNGRAQKSFLQHIGIHAEHPLRFALVSKERMIAASIAYESNDPAPMQHLMTDIADPVKVKQLSDVIEFFERTGYKWQERELACVQPGVTYSGHYVGHQGNDVLFHDGKQGIWVGNYKDIGRSLQANEHFTFTAADERSATLSTPAADPTKKNLIALRLTEQQASLLIAAEYSHDPDTQAGTLHRMKAQGTPILVMSSTVALRYSDRQFQASMDEKNKPALEQRLAQLLLPKARSSPSSNLRELEHGDCERD